MVVIRRNLGDNRFGHFPDDAMTGRIFWAVCWIGILVAMGGVAYGQAADKKPDAKPAASAPA